MSAATNNITRNEPYNLLEKFDIWVQRQTTEISELLTQFIDKYFPTSSEKIVIDEKLYLFQILERQG